MHQQGEAVIFNIDVMLTLAEWYAEDPKTTILIIILALELLTVFLVGLALFVTSHPLVELIHECSDGIRRFRRIWPLVHGNLGGNWFELLGVTGYDLWVCLKYQSLIWNPKLGFFYRWAESHFGSEFLLEICYGRQEGRRAIEIAEAKIRLEADVLRDSFRMQEIPRHANWFQSKESRKYFRSLFEREIQSRKTLIRILITTAHLVGVPVHDQFSDYNPFLKNAA